MQQPKIDFLKEKYDLEKPDEKPFLFFRRVLLVVICVCATASAALSFHTSHTSSDPKTETKLSFFSIVRNFMLPEDDLLDGEADDRVNFLLTGVGGAGHEGPQLTDTIVFASYRPSTESVAFLSLPRDLTVPIDGYGYQKINHVNAYAEAKNPGTGASATADYVGDLLKQPIQYYMRVDFHGFAELIDALGGIDVTVERAFTDPAYPIIGKETDTCGNSEASMNATATDIAGDESGPQIPAPDYSCRFQVLTFKTGVTHMDGETALAFVRSRHGNNGEGSDFARSRRQQLVMIAVKDKVFSASTIFNPVRISGIFDTLQKNISTNLSVAQLMRLGKSFKDLQASDVVGHVLDTSPNSPLYATSLNGAYVLLPKNDDWTVIQRMAQYVYTPEPTTRTVQSAPEPVVQALPSKPQLRVEIQNGTTITGLGFRTSQLLDSQKDFDVIKVGNAVTRGYDHTVIYDLTRGSNPDALQSLKSFLQADIASTSGRTQDVTQAEITVSPEASTPPTPTSSSVDFLVILGQNANTLTLH